MKKFINYLCENSFEILKNKNSMVKVPMYVFIIAMLLNWKVCTILLIVGMFFDLEYSFTGNYEHNTVNTFLQKTFNVVQSAKHAFYHA